MMKRAMIEMKGRNVVASLQGFLRALLGDGGMSALMVAQHLPGKGTVMPTLVSDPERLDCANPLAPAFPLNAARIMSRLTRQPLGRTVAAVLRPCEIRAFIELVKLKQGSLDEVVLIGMDCLGALSNADFGRFAGSGGMVSTAEIAHAPLHFFTKKRDGTADPDITPACKACEYPVPNEHTDLVIELLGADMEMGLTVKANTSKGEALLEKLNLPHAPEPEGRKSAVAELIERRLAYRDRMFEQACEATADMEKLMSFLSNCVNCYNCRVACPVCYCRECVFLTDVFDHEPLQYLRWAERKGVIKMPVDTVFYHLTRMAHMSTACIGCGQCSNACPNGVPVMELFRTIAHFTQRAFDYEPGRSPEDQPPLSVFREHEYSEVTGGRD